MTTISCATTPTNELRQRRRRGSGGGVVVLGGGIFDGDGISIQQKRDDDENNNKNNDDGGGGGGGGGAFAVVSSMFALQKEQSYYHQKEQQAITSPLAAAAAASVRSSSRLADVTAVDRIFPKAAALAVVVWMLLLLFVYTLIPISGRYPLVYLSRQEQEAATAAFCIMCIATLLLIMPFVIGRASLTPGRNGRRSNLSGIVIAALAVQLVSCITNGILAFLPNVVVIDPITHAPVYLTRWCEWIALSGFMTFLSEMVDLEKQKPQVPPRTQQYYQDHPLFEPIVSGLVQSLCCVCGIIFPFCYGLADWSFVMVIALITYLLIFPRALLRKRNFEAMRALRSSQKSSSGVGGSAATSSSGGGGNGSGVYSVAEMEEYERRRFGFYLMSACSIVWSVLVVIYFLNMMAYRFLPPDHPIRRGGSLVMFCDTFFDVLAKAIYMKLIVDVHKSVFDDDGRAHRQLRELRQLMNVFWEDCSDVIVISVQKTSSQSLSHVVTPPHLGGLQDEYGNPCCVYTTMLSSAFLPWVMVEGEEEEAGLLQLYASSNKSRKYLANNRRSACLTLEIRAPIKVKHRNSNSENNDSDDDKPLGKPVVVAAYFVDSSFVPPPGTDTGDIEPSIVCSQDINSLLVQEAAKISNFVWQSLEDQNDHDRHSNMNNNTATTMHAIHKVNGETCFCESKVSRHAGTAANDDGDLDGGGCKSLVAVVRDVTERVRRFEAEQRAHAETLARQRDAQSVNRFTRHEVKNGLLAGIERCDNLRVLVEKNHQSDGRMDTSVTTATSAVHVPAELVTEWTGCALATSLAAATTSTTLPKSSSKLSRIAALNQTSAHDSFIEGVLKQVKDLDKALHDVLDTVLTEAVARDVIHEVYRPQLVPINVEETLTGGSSGFGISGTARLPLIVKGPPIPTIEMDTQLLCYIHRNAVSNACKYGKAGGFVPTIIRFDNDRNEFELQVINEAGKGHDELLAMGESANCAVFEPGERLSIHSAGADKHLSFGDGAWIMRKCANALNGSCTIHFEPTHTIVTFKCPATPVNSSGLLTTTFLREFEVPPGTWGIALDDSKIQRKILGRILTHVGVEQSRSVVLGKTYADVAIMGTKLLTLLRADKENKFLILVDEILDFSSTGDKISGSCAMKDILDQMTPEQERRVLALVRSANDAHHDVQLYCERTHGFFPKSPTQRERVRETLAPLWMSRFEPKSKKEEQDDDAASSGAEEDAGDDNSDSGEDELKVSASEVMESLKSVQNRVNAMPRPLDQQSWPHVWNSLHCLRGDLMMVDNNVDLATASSLINDLRGPKLPIDFSSKWDKIQEAVQRGAKNL